MGIINKKVERGITGEKGDGGRKEECKKKMERLSWREKAKNEIKTIIINYKIIIMKLLLF